MGIDMSKMKAKLAAVNRKGNSEKGNFWRPQDGDTTIRIVPPGDGDPFKEFWFHYNVGNNSPFLSPKKNFGEDCPLDEFVKSLYSAGDPESIKMAKNLSARQRFFAPVLVRGLDHEGVKIWGFGRTAYQELLQLVLNPDYGDITDVGTGTDLVITYGKPAGAQFPQTTITPRRKTSPLVPDSDTVDSLLKSVPDFDNLFDRKTSEEVQSMLDNYLLGEEESTATSVTTTSDSKGTDNTVERAFKELVAS